MLSHAAAFIEHMRPVAYLLCSFTLVEIVFTFDDRLVFNAKWIVIHCLDFLESLAFEYHTHQAAATRECILPATLHAIADRHARQPAATVECIRPNARQTVWYRHARKTAAPGERSVPNTRHAIRYRHVRKAAAVVERKFLNFCHA